MPKSTDEYHKLDRKSIWHPFTRHSAQREQAFPIIARGEGPFLFDLEGNRYLDAISSWWCCNLGHTHPRVIEALKEQCDRLQHSILANLSHPKVIELSDRLLGHFPDRNRRVLFAGDGASAVEAAMRQAVQYWHNIGKPGKNRFAALQEGYHGDTLGAMSLGFMPSFHAPYKDIVMPVHHAEAPFCAGCRLGCSPDTCALECLADMRRILEDHADELAAVVIESNCQGAAGMRIFSPAYLRELSRLCSQHDVLLIVDEIAMGFGRTGRMFSFEHAGIDPDIVCLGKGLSAGYLPVSAAVTRETIYESFNDTPVDHTFYHGHTFAGNPLGMTAALACLKVYEEDRIVEQAAAKGRLMAQEFERFRDLAQVENVRSLGMIAAVDVKDGPDGTPATERAQQVRQTLMNREIMLRPRGNVLYLMPPLITDEELLLDAARKLFEAVSELPRST
ncbi:MAG: adenosylmethionine--8-amino-7-oxononanoate transaminase [bacterium]